MPYLATIVFFLVALAQGALFVATRHPLNLISALLFLGAAAFMAAGVRRRNQGH